MKKLFLIASLAFALTTVLPVFAQESIPDRDKTDVYCVNVVIQRVYPYTKGYAVTYRSGSSKVNTVYIPREWFSFAAHKAELHQLGRGKTRPSMSVFYKAGEFQMVKLYVSKYGDDHTWGVITEAMNLDDKFEGVDKLEMLY